MIALDALRDTCSRALSGHGPVRAADLLGMKAALSLPTG